MCQRRNLLVTLNNLTAVVELSYCCLTLLPHMSSLGTRRNYPSSQYNLIAVSELVLLLSCYCLILFFHTSQRQCSIQLLSQNYLFTVFKLSYHCLILLLHTSPTCQWIIQLSSQDMLITVLELSFYYLITVLFCSSTLLYVKGEMRYHLRTLLLLSQNSLITIFSQSYFALS